SYRRVDRSNLALGTSSSRGASACTLSSRRRLPKKCQILGAPQFTVFTVDDGSTDATSRGLREPRKLQRSQLARNRPIGPVKSWLTAAGPASLLRLVICPISFALRFSTRP